MKALRSSALQVVEKMALEFDDAAGFALSSFMASSRPPGKRVTLSFHCYTYGSFTLLQVHGAPRMAWVRDVARHLEAAGYERAWRLADELGFRRWLSGKRARVAELEFLRAIAETGSPERWPARRTTQQPSRPRRPSRGEWEIILDAVRRADVAWDVCAIGYSRRELTTNVATTETTLEVSAVAFNRLPSDLSIAVSVQLFDAVQELPPATRRRCRDALRGRGYRVDLRSSQIWGTKPTRSAAHAAVECARVFREVKAEIEGPGRLGRAARSAGRRKGT